MKPSKLKKSIATVSELISVSLLENQEVGDSDCLLLSPITAQGERNSGEVQKCY